jgi:hypothetical protein
MEVRFLLHKRDFFWMGFVVVLIGFGVVYAYGGNDPSVMGHSAGELEIDGVSIKDYIDMHGSGEAVVNWDDIVGMPAGFADGVDDIIDVPLVNGVHSSSDCTNDNGEIVSYGGGYFCKFTAPSRFERLDGCPNGWDQYESWSATDTMSCGSVEGYCTVYSSHDFANKDLETCSYPTQTMGSQTCYAWMIGIGCY